MKWGFAALVGATVLLGAGIPDRAAAQTFAGRWTGFYVGANAGGAWGKSQTESPLTSPNCATSWCYIGSVVTDINNLSAQTLTASTFTGGVQAGYAVQFGNWVLGGEADFDAFRLNKTETITSFFTCCGPPGTANTYSNAISTDWLFTARGRLGFAADNWLLYGTGGVAVTKFAYAHTYVEGTAGGGGGVETASASGTLTGYVAGGGFEYAWDRSWSLKAEYLHLDFGDIRTATTRLGSAIQGTSGHAFDHTANLIADIVRVGVNYKLN